MPDSTTPPFGSGRAVAGDVHDAVGALEQRVDDGLRIVVLLDQRTHARRRRRRRRRRQAARPPRSPRARAPASGGYIGRRTCGSPITSTLSSALASRRLGAEFLDAQLAQQLAADRPGPLVARAARRDWCRAAPTESPAVAGSSSITISLGAAEEGLHLDRHQQVEQRAADRRVPVARRSTPWPPARAAGCPGRAGRALRCARAWCPACRRCRVGASSGRAPVSALMKS